MVADKISCITDSICDVLCKINDYECPHDGDNITCKECIQQIAEELLKDNY